MDSERGFRFRGRAAALTRIVNWMGSEVARRVLIVTGSPGVGKSAVLGRIVTTADAEIAASLPAEDDAVRAPIGSIACAVHAKGKTALDVATEIARAASASIPARVEDLPSAIRAALEEREVQQFIIVIDALDEAVSPEESRSVATHITLPLAETCSDFGVRVLVGSRSRDDHGGLIEVFEPAAEIIDLDSEEYFQETDLAAYARATLLLLGSERPGNPYSNPEVAEPVADRIAELSERNFLVAGLVARTHGLYDTEAVRPEDVHFTPTVGAALKEYLYRLPHLGTVKAQDALAALAYSEAPGFSLELWVTSIAAISGAPITQAQLKTFSQSSAANFLIETTSSGDVRQYRLFHQALNDALIDDRGDGTARKTDERAIARALIAAGRISAWERAPEYLLKSLPGHAQRGGVLDELLMDDDYLLYADLRRLIPIADQDASETSRHRAKLIRKTPQAIGAEPDARVAYFSVTEVQEGLGDAYKRSSARTPYRALWATVSPRTEEVALEGAEGVVDAVAAILVDGRQMLASGNDAGIIRLSDPSSGETVRLLEGAAGEVINDFQLCPIRIGNQTLLASASDAGGVTIWDCASGIAKYSLSAANGINVQAMCNVSSTTASYLAIINQEGRLSLWRPEAGDEPRVLEDFDWAESICPLVHNGREYLLCVAEGVALIVNPDDPDALQVLNEDLPPGSASSVCAVEFRGLSAFACSFVTGFVRVFHAETGELLSETRFAAGDVRGLTTIDSPSGNLLVGYHRANVLVWDPDSGEEVRTFTGHTADVSSVCGVRVGTRSMIASGSHDGSVRLWDPGAVGAGQKLEEIRNGVAGVASILLQSRSVLVAGTYSGAVRILSAGTGRTFRSLGRNSQPISAVAAGRIAGRPISLIGDMGGIVHLVDSSTKERFREYSFHEAPVVTIHLFRYNDWSLVATGDVSGKIKIWDPITGDIVSEIEDWFSYVSCISSIELRGDLHLACVGVESDLYRRNSVSLFEPIAGGFEYGLRGHATQIRFVTDMRLGRRDLLVTCADDADVKIWDPKRKSPLVTLTGHRDRVWSAVQLRFNRWTALATGGDDRTIRLWEPGSWRLLLELPVYHPVSSLTQVGSTLVVGSGAGLMSLSVDPAWFRSTAA
ncbi:AAA family ATPase [Streptomyces collinus]|uniref:AAA family ATPase n=1 Tax=Streptomyces collinus TaxID=42684 RepID=UPI0038231294